MAPEAVIVIGTSAGGVTALRKLAAALPSDIPATIGVVQHIGRHRSALPEILSAAGPLPATHAGDGEALRAGHIYVAPPDHHLLIDGDRFRLSRGPRQNFARPAIDPLFRSAAASFGAAAIGVILTGRQNDGTPGLFEIKQQGGIAVVQDPDEAECREMPASALEHVAVDYRLPLTEIPPLLTRLATETAARTKVEQTVKEAMEMNVDYALHRPVALTCPDCGGAVDGKRLGTLTEYRCHIGHTYTAEAMAAAQLSQMEIGIEAALRMINERIELCRQMAERPDVPDEIAKAAWLQAREQAEQRADAIMELLSAGWLSPEE